MELNDEMLEKVAGGKNVNDTSKTNIPPRIPPRLPPRKSTETGRNEQ